LLSAAFSITIAYFMARMPPRGGLYHFANYIITLIKLLARPTGTAGLIKMFIREWSAPTIAILSFVGTLIVGLHFFVKRDLSTMSETLHGIHGDIARIDGSLEKVNGRIDTLLNQALQRAFPAASVPAQRVSSLPRPYGTASIRFRPSCLWQRSQTRFWINDNSPRQAEG
jgi:hypothetical protein